MIKLNRYSKNMAQGGITQKMQESLFASSVVVMGSGALGSGVIMNLAAMGVGKIKLIDSDMVEENNLNCQLVHKEKNINRAKVISAKEWIQEFNSDIKVEMAKIRLSEFNYLNAFQGYDIIVDCFNNADTSYLLNEIALRHEKILIYGDIKAYVGQVTTIVPRKTGCLNCVIKKPQSFNFQNIEAIEPAKLSPIVNTISAIQANEVLKIITGNGEPLLNRLLTFDGLKSEFRTLTYSKNYSCEVCSKFQREDSFIPFTLK